MAFQLKKELRDLQQGTEGFKVKLVDDSNIYLWEAAIFGVPQTPYEGGYFKLHMNFPPTYPYEPPSLRFVTPIWHPNVYPDGQICISILHQVNGDTTFDEDSSEQWNPVRNVRSVLLSVISLLGSPNDSSPANVDASVMYRRWAQSEGADDEYARKVRQIVKDSQVDAARDNVTPPSTIEEYLATAMPAAMQWCDTDSEYDFESADDYA